MCWDWIAAPIVVIKPLYYNKLHTNLELFFSATCYISSLIIVQNGKPVFFTNIYRIYLVFPLDKVYKIGISDIFSTLLYILIHILQKQRILNSEHTVTVFRQVERCEGFWVGGLEKSVYSRWWSCVPTLYTAFVVTQK